VAQNFFGVAEATPCHPGRTATGNYGDCALQMQVRSCARSFHCFQLNGDKLTLAFNDLNGY